MKSGMTSWSRSMKTWCAFFFSVRGTWFPLLNCKIRRKKGSWRGSLVNGMSAGWWQSSWLMCFPWKRWRSEALPRPLRGWARTWALWVLSLACMFWQLSGLPSEASIWKTTSNHTPVSPDGRGIEAYTFIPRHPCRVSRTQTKIWQWWQTQQTFTTICIKGCEQNFNTIFKVINCVGAALLFLNEFCCIYASEAPSAVQARCILHGRRQKIRLVSSSLRDNCTFCTGIRLPSPLCPEMFCRLSHDQDAGAHGKDGATKPSALTLMTEGFPAVHPQKPWESFGIWGVAPYRAELWDGLGGRGSGHFGLESGAVVPVSLARPAPPTPTRLAQRPADLLFAGNCRFFSAQVGIESSKCEEFAAH